MRAVSAISIVVPALALVLSFGCGGTPNNLDPDAGSEPVDSGVPDAGEQDAGLPCEGETAPCAVTWTASSAFPTRVDHHTAFAHTSEAGTFIYVAGGVIATHEAVSEIFTSVRRAAVQQDGSLGAWEDLDPLPRPIGFHAMALTDSRVYLIAGVTKIPAGISAHYAVLVGDFDAEGKLSWRVGPEISQAALHPSAQVIGDRLYVIGGSGTMMDPKSKVFVSTLDETGMPGAFSAGPALPEPRSHHVTVVRDGRIYLVGGFRANQTPIVEVLRSVHDDTGMITGWELAGEMENAPWTAAGFVKGEWLYVIGGGEGGPGQEAYVGRVRRGHFNAKGILATGFEDVEDPLPRVRAHVHHTPVVNDHVYSIGGRDESFSSLDEVYVGKLGAQ